MWAPGWGPSRWLRVSQAHKPVTPHQCFSLASFGKIPSSCEDPAHHHPSVSTHGLVLAMTPGGRLWTPLLYAPGTLLTPCSGLFYRGVCPMSQCEPRSHRNACASLCRGPAQSRAHTGLSPAVPLPGWLIPSGPCALHAPYFYATS